MLQRNKYLQWIHQYRNTPLIKVLVGMRRVGKSTLIEQFKDNLYAQEQLPEGSILHIDMELLKNRDITNAEALHDKVTSYFTEHKENKVLLIDEVQEIAEWEKAINSFLKEGEIDIYITGSNSHMLSSDLATFLAGRYVSLEVLPLSYRETLQLYGNNQHTDTLFQKYLKFGGLPGLSHLPENEAVLFQTLDAYYSTIILRDIIERYTIRSSALLENLVSFFFDNIGNLVTAKSISNYLKSQHIKSSIESVQTYVGYLESCFALHKVKRYDIKGKRHLEIAEKHYLNDLGLRHATLGYRPGDIGQLLENAIYLELRRRGYTISIGKIGDLEIDFIAEKHNAKIYIQVSYLLASEETRKREFTPLKKTGDSYPKYVVTMDSLTQDEEGIMHRYIPEFLLDEGW
ncbi:MAG: ATP-binding protein [Fibrobacterales bacterium]